MILLCTIADVEARLGRPLNTDELSVIDACIFDASAIVWAQAPNIPTNPIPEIVTAVTARLTIKLMSAGAGGVSQSQIQSEALGGYSVSYRSSSEQDQGIADIDLALLRPWARSKIGTVTVNPFMAVVGREGQT
jgi:hypothetical protein